MNTIIDSLKTRRSVRAYQIRQVADEELNAVLEAGLYAPSGMNTQTAVMVAVRNKDLRDRLSKMNAAVMGTDRDPFYGAPCVIVVLANPECRTWVEDGSLVMGNLLNAAHSVGLAGCWIHRAKEMFDTEDGKALLKEWGLPTTLRGVGNCILGYAAETPNERPRFPNRTVVLD